MDSSPVIRGVVEIPKTFRNQTVTEIGMEVGYPSPSSFNRQFRRIHGISPSHWRQKMRSEENPMVTAYFNSLPPSNYQFFPIEYQQPHTP